MAQRPVFIAHLEGASLVEVCTIDFEWCPGLARSQRQKSVHNLHEAIRLQRPEARLLEVSRYSEIPLGDSLSAFNLTFQSRDGRREISVESTFQAAKVFERGGPYVDLRSADPLVAKRDLRLKQSGQLVRFELSGQSWGLHPATAFYDWIYLNALHRRPDVVAHLSLYDAFTDIAFNPQKSVNCQAGSVALYLALEARGLIDEALTSKESFLAVLAKEHGAGRRISGEAQARLF